MVSKHAENLPKSKRFEQFVDTDHGRYFIYIKPPFLRGQLIYLTITI